MMYRTLAGEKVSQLGFGAMRLPQKDGAIDQAEAIWMIRRAIDAGVNYVDTAWPYHGGESEVVVGKALLDGYRNRTFLATKSPLWLIQKPADFEEYLDKQLARLQTDHIDFYMLHAMDAARWKMCQDFDAIGFCERAKIAGKIRHFGFSFHDEAPVFNTVLDAYPWEFCQIQYNLLDRGFQAGQAGLDRAVARGTDVIVMEPLRGGNLAGPIPVNVQARYDQARVERSPVDWCLRWVWDKAGVATVLSGMSHRDQLEENLHIAGAASPGCLAPEERVMLEEVEAEYRRLIEVNCTACRYCMPCPHGVDIPRNFAVFNSYAMFDRSAAAKGGYNWIGDKEKAHQCVDCGECEPLCPQHLPIRQDLKRVVAALGS